MQLRNMHHVQATAQALATATLSVRRFAAQHN
jgi:hypothetical protein